MTVSAETVEALHAVKAAWDHCQSICEHRNPARDDEGQGSHLRAPRKLQRHGVVRPVALPAAGSFLTPP